MLYGKPIACFIIIIRNIIISIIISLQIYSYTYVWHCKITALSPKSTFVLFEWILWWVIAIIDALNVFPHFKPAKFCNKYIN